MMKMVENTKLWHDYLFLTREMRTFLSKQDMVMFYELLDQRERLQGKIQDAGDYSFLSTDEGRLLAAEVQDCDKVIGLNLRGGMARLRQQREVKNKYRAAYQPQAGLRANHLG
jgi:hypothetical protein